MGRTNGIHWSGGRYYWRCGLGPDQAIQGSGSRHSVPGAGVLHLVRRGMYMSLMTIWCKVRFLQVSV